jgi:hypothetical protein
VPVVGMRERQERLSAAIEMIRRTGATQVQIRYHDDEQPTVWIVVARFQVVEDGLPAHRYEMDAALDPFRAAARLCERLVDGAVCVHCRRPAGLDPDSLDTLPFDDLICWYQYDPENKTFRRGCES